MPPQAPNDAGDALLSLPTHALDVPADVWGAGCDVAPRSAAASDAFWHLCAPHGFVPAASRVRRRGQVSAEPPRDDFDEDLWGQCGFAWLQTPLSAQEEAALRQCYATGRAAPPAPVSTATAWRGGAQAAIVSSPPLHAPAPVVRTAILAARAFSAGASCLCGMVCGTARSPGEVAWADARSPQTHTAPRASPLAPPLQLVMEECWAALATPAEQRAAFVVKYATSWHAGSVTEAVSAWATVRSRARALTTM